MACERERGERMEEGEKLHICVAIEAASLSGFERIEKLSRRGIGVHVPAGMP